METDACGHPIRDPELLRRIEKAKSSQRLHDPIEDNPRIRPIVREVQRRAEKESPIVAWGAAKMSGVAWSRFSKPSTASCGIRPAA
jgi:hypothetical protein